MILRLAALARGRSRLGLVAGCTLACMLTTASTPLLACPNCFGAEETTLIDGTRLGILVMLGITFTVQGGFLGFFLYLRRRAKRLAEQDLDNEWSELQRPTRSS